MHMRMYGLEHDLDLFNIVVNDFSAWRPSERDFY
jgi:hypothetical protein